MPAAGAAQPDRGPTSRPGRSAAWWRITVSSSAATARGTSPRPTIVHFDLDYTQVVTLEQRRALFGPNPPAVCTQPILSLLHRAAPLSVAHMTVDDSSPPDFTSTSDKEASPLTGRGAASKFYYSLFRGRNRSICYFRYRP